MKKNIIITGADGFVGSHLCRALEKDYNLTKLITPGQTEIPEERIFSVDLTNKQKTAEFAKSLDNTEFYALVHLAFILCKPGDWKNYIYLDKNNDISKNVISLSNTLNIDNVINFSSLAVYPNIFGNYSEDSCINPSVNTECLYGLAKFNSEMIFNFASDNSNVINLRMTQVYGPGMQEDRLVGMLREEVKNKNSITIFGNGERVSNFIYIDDVVESLAKVLESPVSGTYNMGCAENISYLEIGEILKSGLGNDSTEIKLLDKGVKARVRINTRKFEKTFEHINTKKNFDYTG